jgi:superfamily II DNA or RNA helicase
MVLVQSEQKLMMMRPYQIYAVEAIVECIDDNRGNGYIWHTTGSGKTSKCWVLLLAKYQVLVWLETMKSCIKQSSVLM